MTTLGTNVPYQFQPDEMEPTVMVWVGVEMLMFSPCGESASRETEALRALGDHYHKLIDCPFPPEDDRHGV